MTIDIEATLAKLSDSEKISLLAGRDFWHTAKIEKHDIPSVRMSDGPNGVRGTAFFNGTPSSCFPCSTGVGSSWDVDLAKEIGNALAIECKEKGAHVLLGPTVNTQRSPLGGRGFESFSEDPLLNGMLAAAYINGVQEKGVVATIKHFVCNDQEKERFSIDSVVSERALREIYLKPFAIAIKESNPWALMTAYNRVNGIHVSEDPLLLDEILRKEWKYEGTIMSDWGGCYSTAESIKAGLDIEMPGPAVERATPLVSRALTAKKLTVQDINVRARKVLELVKKAQESEIPFDAEEKAVDTPELRDLLRRSAADATVLLKNSASLLPLSVENLASKSIKTIGVIGSNAKIAFLSGGGSAQLLASYAISPLQGISAAAKELLGQKDVPYAIGAPGHRFLPLVETYLKDIKVEFFNEAFREDGKPGADAQHTTSAKSSNLMFFDNIPPSVNSVCWHRFSGMFTPDEDGDWEFSLVVAGQGNLYIDGELVIDNTHDQTLGEAFFGQGSIEKKEVFKNVKAGREYKLEVRSTNEKPVGTATPFGGKGAIRIGAWKMIKDQEAIEEAVEVAKKVDAVILMIGLSHDWESEGYDRANMDLPRATNALVSTILKANPNVVIVNQSGTPVEMPWIEDAPTVVQAFFGGNELGNGLADVLFGKRDICGKLPLSFPRKISDSPSFISFPGENSKVVYNEGTYVGYRNPSFKPLFSFGHGLTYSEITYSHLVLPSKTAPNEQIAIQFTVKNTGSRATREISQVYVSDQSSSLPRPEKELQGFKKVWLEAGEEKKVEISLGKEALAFWDDVRKCWVAEKGVFEIRVGGNSTEPALKGEVELTESFTWTGL